MKKRLLSIVLTVAMLATLFANILVPSATDAGTLTVGTTTITQGTTEAVVDITVDLPADVYGPHELLILTIPDGFTLSAVELADVVYTQGNTPECAGVITIGDPEDGTNGTNLTTGAILLESSSVDATDANCPVVDSFVIKATYTVPADVAVGTYAITVDNQLVDATPADIALTVTDGAIVVEAPAPDCDHANVTYVDNKDGTHTATCPDCSNVETVEHNSYTNAVCACGAKFIDTSLTGGYLSSATGKTPEFNIMFNTNDFAAYASYELVASRVTNDDNFNFKSIVEEVVTNYTTEYAPYIVWIYDTVELYSLTVPVTFQVRCYDAEGNVAAYSPEYTSTLKQVLVDTYNGTSDLGLKRVITDILNVGAESQKFMTLGKESCDYATKLEIANEGWDQTYATTELGEMGTYNDVKNGSDAQIYMSAATDASLYPCFIITGFDANSKASYNLEISFYDVINKETLSKTINLASTDPDEIADYGSSLVVTFKDVPMYSTNAEITADFLKDGSSIGTVSYCLDAFISESLSNAQTGPALRAIAYLSQSFRAFNGL